MDPNLPKQTVSDGQSVQPNSPPETGDLATPNLVQPTKKAPLLATEAPPVAESSLRGGQPLTPFTATEKVIPDVFPAGSKTNSPSTRSVWRSLLIAGAILIAAVIILSLYFLNQSNKSQQANVSNFNVTSIPLADLAQSLSVKGGQLTVNGQLRINNSFVLTPSDTPVNPLVGQFYLDKDSTSLFYYDGSVFRELATTSQIAELSSLSRATPGAGLALNGRSLTNTGVLTLQGQSGNLTLTTGGGIAINGLNFTNTGVLSVTGTNHQIAVSAANGNITLTLPQNIDTAAAPTFSSLQLSSLNPFGVLYGDGSGNVNSTLAGVLGQCLKSNGAGAPTYQNCTAGSSGIGVGTSQTPGKLTKWDSVANTITDSLVSELGTTVTVGGDLSVQNPSNSTTAFQVQTSTATPVVTVDTVNSQVNIQGANSDATLGSELSPNNDYTVGGDWTTTGWTTTTSDATHNTGNISPLIDNQFATIAGHSYKVTFDVSGAPTSAPAGVADVITPRIGGTFGQNVFGDGTFTQVIIAGDTSGLQFRPTTNWNGTISNVSVVEVTPSNSALNLLDSGGNISLEVRAPSRSQDIFIGSYAGSSNTSGSANTGVGSNSLASNTSGADNTAVGASSLQYNTTGQLNNAFGSSSLAQNTVGSYNSAFGALSLAYNVNGDENAAFGGWALNQNQSGSQNTAVGLNALNSNYNGNYNTALGYYAGVTTDSGNANYNGSSNTFVGAYSGPGSVTQLQNASAFGAYSVVSQNDSLVLGCLSGVNGCTATTKVGIGVAAPTATLSLPSGTTASEGIAFGTDTNLYRDSAGTLRTDGKLKVGNQQASDTYLISRALDVNQDFGVLNNNGGAGSHIDAAATASTTGFSILVGDYIGTTLNGANPSYGVAVGSYAFAQSKVSAGTVQYLQGVIGETANNGAATVANAVGVVGGNDVYSTGGITDARSFYAASPGFYGGTGTIDTSYGLYVDPQKIAGVTNGYGIYQAGSNDLNYLAGDLTVGTLGSGGTAVLCSNAGKISTCGSSAGSGSYIYNGISLQSANFAIQSALPGNIGGLIKGAVGQTADLFQIQDSTGSVMDKFDATGRLTVASSSSSPGPTVSISGKGEGGLANATLYVNNTSNGYALGVNGDENLNGSLYAGSGSFTAVNGSTVLTASNTGNGGGTALSLTSTGSSGGTNEGSLIKATSGVGQVLTLQNDGGLEALGYYNNGYGGIGAFGNLLTYSEQLDNAAWTATNITVSADSGTAGINPAPDGQTSAEKLATSASGTHTITQTCTTGCTTNSATYTYTIWLKTNSGTQAGSLRIDWNNGAGQTGSANNFTITNTWQRFSVAQTVSASGMVSVTPTLTINNNSINVAAWGAQLYQRPSGATTSLQAYVRSTGSQVANSSGVVSNGGLFVSAINSTDKPLIVQGAPSQSGDLLQVQDSSGTTLAKVNASGQLTVNGSVSLSSALGGVSLTSIGDGALRLNADGAQVIEIQNGAIDTNSRISIAQTNTINLAPLGYVVNADPPVGETGTQHSASSNFLGQEAGVTTFKVAPLGNTLINLYNTNAGVGLTVKGASGQTADLLQFQNNSGTYLAGVNAAGVIWAKAGLKVGGDGNFNPGTTLSVHGSLATTTAGYFGLGVFQAPPATGAVLSTFSSSGTSSAFAAIGGVDGVVAYIQGVASQTSDLLQLRNSSNNVLSKFNSNGDLQVGGTSSRASTTAFQVQTTSGAALLNVDTSNTRLEVVGDIYSDGMYWTSRTSAADNDWSSVTYANGLFVAVSWQGTIMTSPDGVNWTTRSVGVTQSWNSVTYGNGLFVAVSSGSGTTDRVMTSPDGINWTNRNASVANNWSYVTYGNGLFVAVAIDGTGNRVMTSPDGVNWTTRTSAADNAWQSVTYGNGLFVAVSNNGSANRVMTSPDGITWTTRTSSANSFWNSVTYGNGLFVAVSGSTGSTSDEVMTSPDGITWTTRTSAADNEWANVSYGEGLFVAVANSGTGNRVMTSTNGINWTSRTSAADNSWLGLAYGNGMFVSTAFSGSGNRVMTSGRPNSTAVSTNNTRQGGMTLYGSSLQKSDTNSTTAFQIQNASGGTIFNVDTTNGYVGIGTASANRALEVTATNAPVARFNRSNDGSVVEFASGGTVQGDISISGGTTSYNAFTGSHYGYTSQTLHAGELLTQTGSRSNGLTEIEYKAERSTRANDPKILGSYLDHRTNGPADGILISAAGNGDLWVTDTGGNITEGDYLISSDVAGHAMADPGSSTISHIVARAEEPVDWSHVSDTINGHKHAKISVYYTFFDKTHGVGQSMQGGEQSFENLSVSGNIATASLNVSGQANIQDLRVVGTATIAELRVTDAIVIDGDITIGGHFKTAGAKPTAQTQTASGIGASVTVDGNDTSGTITITTGASGLTKGDLVKVLFSKAYGAAPRVIISPVGENAADLRTYLGVADPVFFTWSSKTIPEPDTPYSFNYWVVQ